MSTNSRIARTYPRSIGPNPDPIWDDAKKRADKADLENEPDESYNEFDIHDPETIEQ